MSEQKDPFGFQELGDGGLDIASIFGDDPSNTEPPPFLEPQAADATKTTEPTTPAEKQAVSLFDKPPVFSYGGAKERITDTSLTFEELRVQKAEDFPELEEGKKVSWSVKYGGENRAVADPKGTTIAKIKEEIEGSKAFLDGLKKAKCKDPDCLLIPTVRAQSKGTASYKGIFPSVAAARASEKVICLIPSRNGQIFELRKTEMGEVIAPKDQVADFEEVRAGFIPALPPIPRELMGQIISFFRSFMGKNGQYEALVNIYWDRQRQEFLACVPRQTATRSSVTATLDEDRPSEERYYHYADIHSHNSMEARFSAIDDRDERATRLYLVLGRLDRFYPQISARVSCGGSFLEIDPQTVLEGMGEEFPMQWLDRVKTQDRLTGGMDQ